MSATAEASTDRATAPGTPARETFEAWYEDHFPRLTRYCARLSEPQMAQELAQEAMARALAALDRFDASRPPWPWLKTIAINLVIDMKRKAGREVPMEDPGIHAPDHDHPVEDRLMIEEALARLSPRHREVIDLRYLEGWEARRIASHLDLSQSALRQLLFRARARLRMEYRRMSEASLGILVLPVGLARRGLRGLWRGPGNDVGQTSVAAAAGSGPPALATGLLALAVTLGGGVQTGPHPGTTHPPQASGEPPIAVAPTSDPRPDRAAGPVAEGPGAGGSSSGSTGADAEPTPDPPEAPTSKASAESPPPSRGPVPTQPPSPPGPGDVEPESEPENTTQPKPGSGSGLVPDGPIEIRAVS